MKIRESVEDDKMSIRKVHQNAFGQSEGETVSQLAIDLLEDKTALPILSLLAERDNEITGNVIFSSASIEGFEGISTYILAPLAVTKREQRSGIGTLLINKGLETLRERGADIVLVYQRINEVINGRRGITPSTALRLSKFFGVSADFWMNLQLRWDLYFARESETEELKSIIPISPQKVKFNEFSAQHGAGH